MQNGGAGCHQRSDRRHTRRTWGKRNARSLRSSVQSLRELLVIAMLINFSCAVLSCLAGISNAHLLPAQPIVPGAQIAALQKLDEASLRDEASLKARIAAADLVVAGQVRSVQPGPVAHFLSEHDPHWQDAIVEVQTYIKGSHRMCVVIRFASSMDVAWFQSPKLKKGEEHIFILKKFISAGTPTTAIVNGVAQLAYTALDSQDVLSKNDLSRVLSATRKVQQHKHPD